MTSPDASDRRLNPNIQGRLLSISCAACSLFDDDDDDGWMGKINISIACYYLISNRQTRGRPSARGWTLTTPSSSFFVVGGLLILTQRSPRNSHSHTVRRAGTLHLRSTESFNLCNNHRLNVCVFSSFNIFCFSLSPLPPPPYLLSYVPIYLTCILVFLISKLSVSLRFFNTAPDEVLPYRKFIKVSYKILCWKIFVFVKNYL